MNPSILNPSDSTTFIKQFPVQSTLSSPEQPKRSSFSKTRISIVYNGREEFVSWYGSNTPSQTIEEAIKTVFQLPSNVRLFLKDMDGDVVAIAPTLPAGETFCLFISNNNGQSSSSPSPKLSSGSISATSSSGINMLVKSFENASQKLDESNDQIDLTTNSSSIMEKQNIQLRSSSTSSSPEPLKSVLLSENDVDDELSSGPQKRLSGDLSGLDEEDDEDDPRKKRKRRKAVEIDRSFKCSMANCQKIYGSENALKMHIKLKHPEYQYLIMQQIPLCNKTSPPIIVNNKLLNYNNGNNVSTGYVHPQHSQSYQQYQAQVQAQVQAQQQQQYQQSMQNNRVPTSLLFQQQQQHQQQLQQQRNGIPSMKYYNENQNQSQPYQHQHQQSQQPPQQYNGGNGLPKLFNNTNNSQVPTTELRSHLASFLAKERSNNNNNNNTNRDSDPYSTINKIISATNMTNFFPSNLHPSFFQSFQQQLNQLIAGNPGIAQDILKYDIEELSTFIKKQIDQVKLKQNEQQQQGFQSTNRQQSQQPLNNRLPNFNYFSSKSESDDEDIENGEHRLKRFSFSAKRQPISFERNQNKEDKDNTVASITTENNETLTQQQQKPSKEIEVDSELTTPNSSPVNNSNNICNNSSSNNGKLSKPILPSIYSSIQSSPISTSSTNSKGNLSFLVSSNDNDSEDEDKINNNKINEDDNHKSTKNTNNHNHNNNNINSCTKNEPNTTSTSNKLNHLHQQPDANAASLLLNLQHI